jgi:UTP--glucose-1-phosphate uridylyltransferase
MINMCLFPAAGYGTRFLPATKAVPKEMLPILNKPLLQLGVEEAMAAGINNMAIVTGRGKRAIEDHFDNSFEVEAQLRGTSKEFYLNEINHIIENSTFTYVRQKQILGLGHAVLTGQSLIGNQAFAVILADDLCDCDEEGVISQISKIYNKYQCSVIAIEEIPLTKANQYGIVIGELIDGTKDTYRVTNMIEKPNSDDLIEFTKYSNHDQNNTSMVNGIIGRYILTPDIFDSLKKIKPGKNGEIQITDALISMAKKSKIIAYKFKGKRFDCGSIEGYVDATNHFAKIKGVQTKSKL